MSGICVLWFVDVCCSRDVNFSIKFVLGCPPFLVGLNLLPQDGGVLRCDRCGHLVDVAPIQKLERIQLILESA